MQPIDHPLTGLEFTKIRSSTTSVIHISHQESTAQLFYMSYIDPTVASTVAIHRFDPTKDEEVTIIPGLDGM